MAYRSRVRQPRFKLGDRVEIRSVIATRFYGLNGVVAGIVEHTHSCTADKYTIQLDTGESALFWDIQLKTASDTPHSRSNESAPVFRESN